MLAKQVHNIAICCCMQEGSQETLATLVGMLLGMCVAQWTAGHAVLMWTVFLSLTAFHMYGGSLTFRTPQREASGGTADSTPL